MTPHPEVVLGEEKGTERNIEQLDRKTERQKDRETERQIDRKNSL